MSVPESNPIRISAVLNPDMSVEHVVHVLAHVLGAKDVTTKMDTPGEGGETERLVAVSLGMEEG